MLNRASFAQAIERLKSVPDVQFETYNRLDHPNLPPYQYAKIETSNVARLSEFGQIAIEVDGYLSMHCYEGAQRLQVAISAELAPEEISAVLSVG